MYFRVKSSGSYRYLQIVESYREGKRVRQRVFATLGRLDVLEESGDLDALIRSGLRLCQGIAAIDAHSQEDHDGPAVRRIGPDLVFGRLWNETGIEAALRGTLQKRRFEFDVERAIYLTVLHRLFASGSDRAAERWRENYLIPGAENLELHHLYRAMGWLGQPLGQREKSLGSPRCTKDLIEELLFDRRRDLFSEINLVFFDTTSIYFEGGGGQSIGQRGHSKDHRPDLKQMIVGLVLDAEGWPLCCEMWPGNTTDVKTLLPLVKSMKRRFGVHRVSIVADRGMISKATVAALESQEVACDYVLGVRMRRTKEVAQQVLSHRGRFHEVQPERRWAKDPSPLKVKEVWVGDRRYVVCLNEEQKRKDALERRAILTQLREQLKQGDKSLVGNQGYRKYLKNTSDSGFAIDAKKIKEEARYDGKWVLTSNLDDLDAETISNVYKQLWMVEDLFRTMKSILETRPVYHKCDETIRGHVFCSFLSLILKRELERRLEARNEEWEWAEILRGLDNLYEVESTFQGQRFLLRSQTQGQAHKAVKAAGVALPPTIRKLD